MKKWYSRFAFSSARAPKVKISAWLEEQHITADERELVKKVVDAAPDGMSLNDLKTLVKNACYLATGHGRGARALVKKGERGCRRRVRPRHRARPRGAGT